MNVLLFLLYWLSTFPLLFSHFLHPSFTRSVPLCIFFLIPFFYHSHPCHCGSMALESNYSSPHSLSPPHRILLTLNEKKSRRRERWLVELQSPLAWVHWPHLFCTVIPLLFLSDSHKPCLVISSSFHILPTSSAPQYDSCWWFPCPFVPPRKDSLILLSSHSCLCFNLSLLSLLSSRGIVKMKLSSPSFGKKVLFHRTMPSQERQVRNAECTAFCSLLLLSPASATLHSPLCQLLLQQLALLCRMAPPASETPCCPQASQPAIRSWLRGLKMSAYT